MLAGVLAVAAVFGIMSGFALWRFVRAPRPDWRNVPGYAAVRCFAPREVTPEDVGLALRLALASLDRPGLWDSAQLRAVVSRLDIYVRSTNEWVDGWGRNVAGSQIGRTLVVGRDLAALCHEVAHLAELVLEGVEDAGHLRWNERGIRAAETDYHRRLRGDA